MHEKNSNTGRYRKPRILALGAVGGVLALGLLVYYATSAKAEQPVPQAAVKQNAADAAATKTVESTVAEVVPPLSERVEQAILAGSYAKSLKLIREWEGQSEKPNGNRAYCLGLANEGLKRWSEARRAYREARRLCDDNSQSAVRLALSRCAIALGNRHEAEQLIRETALQSASSQIQIECLYHLALHADQIAEPRATPNPLDARALAWPKMTIEPDQILQRLAVKTRPEPYQEEKQPSEKKTGPHSETSESSRYIPREQMYEMMLAATKAGPSHPSAVVAKLIVATSWHEAGRTEAARKEYEIIRINGSHREYQTIAAYNQGLLEHDEGRYASAREAFLEAADRNRGTRWERLGWWWIGRMELDLGNRTQARAAWQRVSGSNDREMESAVEICQILMKLMDNETDGVVRPRGYARDQQHKDYGELIEAWERYQEQPTENRARRITDAIRAVGYCEALGPAGSTIAGEMLAKTGHPELQMALYEQVIPKMTGYWASQCTIKVALRLKAQGHLKEARQRLLAVLRTSEGEVNDQAKLALAELALIAKDPRLVLSYCESLGFSKHISRETVGRVMGEAHEMLGNRRKAAECFSGNIIH